MGAHGSGLSVRITGDLCGQRGILWTGVVLRTMLLLGALSLCSTVPGCRARIRGSLHSPSRRLWVWRWETSWGAFPFETCRVPAPFQPATDHFSSDREGLLLKPIWMERALEQSNTVLSHSH